MYSHLLELPQLRQLTVWPPPPQSATSDFWCGWELLDAGTSVNFCCRQSSHS